MAGSTSKSAAALRQVLEEHKANELNGQSTKNGGNVVELDSNIKPIDAAKTLWTHNILGAPVWSEADGKYVGFVDMRDMLSVVVATAKKCAAAADGDSEEYNIAMVKELDGLAGGADATTLTYLAARNPFCYATPDCTLATLCKELVTKRCHRVPIVSSEGERCSNIISQSALVKFLSANATQEALEESLSDAGMSYNKDIVSIIDSASAYEAFELMDSKRLSGIAVVDEDGMLIGNTSARDIRLAACDKGHHAMDTDILSYLAAVRQATPSKKERYPSCHVHEDATVAHVVNLLAKTGYHRVFVVDKDVKPVGVISVQDIINFAMN